MKGLVMMALAGVLGVAVMPAAAQQAVIYGTVADASKAVLPGVTVTVTNQGTGLKQSVPTSDRGDYRIVGLPLGVYSVVAELVGFTTMTRKDIALGLEAQVRVDFTLELASVREAVVVVGESPLVEIERSEVGGNVTAEQIKTLPVTGRQWINLATLMPGTGQDAIRAQFYNSVNIGAGINYYSNGFYVDNVTNNWQQQGEPRQDFPQDSIAEFRVHSFNAPPVYGFAQGGYLSAVTKSGTNEFHGDLFEFYRDKSLNARTIFQSEKPNYRRHQMGGALGGPVVQNRAQFFAAYEYTDESQYFTVNTRGIFPEYEGTYLAPQWNHMAVGRFDQTVSDQHRLFARYALQRNLLSNTGSGGIAAPSAGSNFSAPRDAVVVGETWVISNRAVNEFRFQRAMATYIGWPSVPGLKWTKAGSFPQERLDSLPDIVTRPSLRLGNASSFIGPERRFEIKDDLTYTIGSHELAVGVDLNWILWTPDNFGSNRSFSFSTDAPFDPNNRATYPFNFQQRLSPTHDRVPSTEHSAYVGDTWRPTSTLTLNGGLRYDVQTGVWNEDLLEQEQPEVRLVDRVLRPAGKLDPTLFPFYDGSTRGDWNNFGPRIGMTWDVSGTGRQVIRAAYGLYYNRYRANPQRAELSPLQRLVIIANPNYPDPYQGRDPYVLAATVRNITIQGNANRTPHTHQFSLGTTRQIGSNMAVSVDGTVANGYKQATTRDLNYFADAAARAARRRPNANFGQVQENRTEGLLRYRAVEMRVTRRMADQWQFTGSYTVGYARNTNEGFPADHFDPGADYGWADADRRHRLTLSGIVQTFYDVQFSSILKYQSNLAVNILAGRDLNGDTITNDRPPGITRNTGCRDLDLGAVNEYRQANRLAPATSFFCGGYLTLDLQASKTFEFGGQRSLELIFQVFNLTNRANYLPAVGNALSPLFGQSTAVASGRQGELAIRLNF
ncbi:MAG: TonB-dependent receptor [Acidobacteria bacterium]|nr:TonB-dependent receptor [Acidobacteriota bacterium]